MFSTMKKTMAQKQKNTKEPVPQGKAKRKTEVLHNVKYSPLVNEKMKTNLCGFNESV